MNSVIFKRSYSILLWIVLALIGILLTTPLNTRLTTSLTIPHSESAHAQNILTQHFDDNPEGTFILFYKFSNATPEQLLHFKSQIAEAISTIDGAHITQSRAFAGYLFTSVGTPYDLARASELTTPLRKALIHAGISPVLVTGPPAIKSDVTPIMNSDLHRGELIAIGIALVLPILILGWGWLSVVPLLFALINISSSLALIYLLSLHFTMVLYVPNIVQLIGLGLAIDYSLLYIHRYRSELKENRDIELAISRTRATAGRTITISGFSVFICSTILLLIPVPFIRSLGLAAIVIPVVSVISTRTFLPHILLIFGKRGAKTLHFHGFLNTSEISHRLFASIGHISRRTPLLVMVLSLGALAALSASLFTLDVTPSALTQLPANMESARGVALVTDQLGKGVITPHQIVIDLGKPQQAQMPEIDSARQTLVGNISQLKEVFAVASDSQSTFVDPTGQYIRIIVAGRSELGSAGADKLTEQLREILRSSTFPHNTKLYLGGTPAQGADLIHALSRSLPWVFIVALLVMYVILRRFLSSVVLPIKAITLDLVSLVASLGALVFVTRSGIAHQIFGTYDYQQTEAWVLIFIVAILFGLSMDYEIFIVSRIREAWLSGKNNEDAVVEGLAQTGGVVSAAALILIGAVSGFIWGDFVGLQQLGIGLALGILIDATIVRLFLLPSAMVLLGKWNWRTSSRRWLLRRDSSAQN